MPEEDIPPHDLIRFEIEHCGTPVSTFPELRDEYAVLEVDDRYSPKVKLCSLATGRTGVMKLKKALYRYQPLEPGEILKLLSWERRPAYHTWTARHASVTTPATSGSPTTSWSCDPTTTGSDAGRHGGAWWNWQTRRSLKPLPEGVRVRVSLLLPNPY